MLSFFTHLSERLRRHTNVVGLILLVLHTIVFFSPTLFLGRVPLPTDLVTDYLLDLPREGVNPWIRDAVVQAYPYSDIIYQNVHAGRPLRDNPYVFGGMDLATTGQAPVFSPLNLLIPFFSSSLAFFSFKVVFFFFAGGAGLFLFLRARGHRFLLALLGAVLFQLSGPFMAWTSWGTIAGVLATFPFFLWGIERFAQTHARRWLGVLFLAHVFAVTSGHLQIYAYVCVASLAYGVFRLWITRHTKPLHRKDGVLLLFCFFLLAGTTWLVVSPFLAALPLSHRSTLTDTSAYSPKNLLQFFAPFVWGDAHTFHGPLNLIETFGYIGLLPLLGLVMGLVLMPKRVLKGHVFWFVLIGVSFLYMMVPQSVAGLYGLFPFLQRFPTVRALFLVSTALIILAVHALHVLFQHPLFQKPFFTVQRGLRVQMMLLVLIGFALVDQHLAVRNLVPQQQSTPLLHPPAYVDYLQHQSIHQPLIYSELSPLNLYALYAIRSLFGYDSAYPESVYQLFNDHGVVLSHRNILNVRIDDVDFLRSQGVDFVVTRRAFPLEPVFEADGVFVYTTRLSDPVPAL